MNSRLADNEFVAGPRYSVADITALVTVDFAVRAKMPIPEAHSRLRRWHTQVSARPSAKA
jgi:glutathione S-transferase